MRVFRKKCLSILLALFLINGLSYSQVFDTDQFLDTEFATELIHVKAVRYAIKGEFEKAKDEFERVLKVDPSHIQAKISLEIINAVNERKIIKEAAVLVLNSGYNIGKGQYDLAINESNKALSINPNYAEAYNSRAIAYAKKGQDNKAISDYTKAIEINSNLSHFYNNRGLAYRRLDQYERAISDYTKAIEINPRKTLYNNRAVAYYYNRVYIKSQKDVKKAQDLGLQVNQEFIETLDNAQRGNNLEDVISSLFIIALGLIIGAIPATIAKKRVIIFGFG